MMSLCQNIMSSQRVGDNRSRVKKKKECILIIFQNEFSEI